MVQMETNIYYINIISKKELETFEPGYVIFGGSSGKF